MWIDSQHVADDVEIYNEYIDQNGEQQATVEWCVRFSLHTSSATPNVGNVEVNYLEVIVSFDADLTDGFQIGTLNLQPVDRCQKEAQESYEVEGYFCEDGTEDTAVITQPVLNQGEFVKVCVRPVQRALDQGIRMRRLVEFKWKLVGSTLEQTAIESTQAAANQLTELYCEAGYAICHFQSLLFASFFATAGVVTGTGLADLQFGGEASPTSVTPKPAAGRRNNRRLGGGGETSTRKLQIDIDEDTGSSIEFTMEATVAKSDMNFGYTSGGAAGGGVSLGVALIVAVVSHMIAYYIVA
jgi:hypothetical protein